MNYGTLIEIPAMNDIMNYKCRSNNKGNKAKGNL